MGRLARILFLVVTCCVALAISADALAQQERWRAGPAPKTTPPQSAIDEARRRYLKGVKLYDKEGAVDAALAEMQRAYDLAPSYKVLFNLGQVARTARDYALALHTFERYLADGGDKIGAPRRAAVAKEIKELKTYVSALTVTVDVEGASIHVNDMQVAVSPLAEPIMVNAGRARIRAVKGPSQNSKTIVIPGGDEITVALALTSGAATVAPPASATLDPTTPMPVDPSSGPDEPSKSTPYLWVGWATAGAFAAGATITGVLALTQSGDLDSEVYAGTEPPAAITDQQDTITALAITTDVFIGAAILSVGVTTVFAILGVGAEPDDDQETDAAWTLTPLPPSPSLTGQTAGHDRWGLAVTGRF